MMSELTDSREYTLEELKAIKRLVEETKSNITSQFTVYEIWREFYNGSVDKGSKYVNGLDVALFLYEREEVLAHVVYSCYLLLLENDHLFEFQSINGFICRDARQVEELQKRRQHRLEEEEARKLFLEKVKGYIARLQNTTVDGEDTEEIIFDGHYDVKFFQKIKEYALEESPNVFSSHVAEQFLEPLGLGTRPHDAFSLLVKLDLCHSLENPHLLRWDNHDDIQDDQCIREAQQILDNAMFRVDDLANLRADLTTLPVFTLSEEKTDYKEVGFSSKMEGRDKWIYIHMADPTRYIPLGSLIERVAKSRAMSVFLPERSFHMLPDPISRAASLEEFRDRPTETLTVALKIEKNGAILDYKVFWSRIQKIFNLTYSEGDEIMGSSGDKKSSHVNNYLQVDFEKDWEVTNQEWMDFEQFAERRKQFRKSRSAIDFLLPDSRVKITHKNTHLRKPKLHVDISLTPTRLYNARAVMSECEVTSSFANGWEFPLIHIARPPLPDKLDFAPSNDPLEDRIRQLSIDKVKPPKPEKILENLRRMRSLPPEYFTLKKSAHHGMGISGYAPVAHPLQSYIALANQYQLKQMSLASEWESSNAGLNDHQITSLGPTTAFSSNALAILMEEYQAKKTEIELLQQNSKRYWILMCIKNETQEKKTTSFTALVITARDDKNEALLFIQQYALEAKMGLKRKLSKGDIIKVIVDHVDPFYGHLILKEFRDDFGVIE